ncbi:MAG: peptide deformylase [Gammaproteobacteria bacterium]|nr:MAG: peptide deformylase [Gammaproteobacteria bacterium]PIE38515.1 MAG: peptide deformylase [Gammaproteobacteria bacterium]
MSVLDILYFPTPELRRTAAAVENVNGQVATLIDSMFETMYSARGIGLAATQVNVHERVIVVDVSDAGDQPLALVNPELVETHGSQETQEGCLSIPGFYEKVKRPSEVRVAAVDRDGNPFEVDADGLLAVCLQHEIDHLNGKLFVDHLSSLKRNRIHRKMSRWIRDGADLENLPGNA